MRALNYVSVTSKIMEMPVTCSSSIYFHILTRNMRILNDNRELFMPRGLNSLSLYCGTLSLILIAFICNQCGQN